MLHCSLLLAATLKNSLKLVCNSVIFYSTFMQLSVWYQSNHFVCFLIVGLSALIE